MELLAVINGLESVIDNITSQKIKLDKILFYTTSKYLYNAYSKGWIYKWKANNWMKSEWNGLPPRPIRNSDFWKHLIDYDEKHKQMGVYFQLHFFPIRVVIHIVENALIKLICWHIRQQMKHLT